MNAIYLSRRNLQTLLNKLDRRAAGEQTAATIIKYRNPEDPEEYMQTFEIAAIVGIEEINEELLEVHAVENADFYRERDAGLMLPIDDPALRKRNDT